MVKINTRNILLLWMISINILTILSTKWTQNFQILLTFFFWKGPKSIHSFKKMSDEDIKTYLRSLPNKFNNDILIYWESAPYTFTSLANVINKSLKSGVIEHDWKNVSVTPIYKDDGDINDENNYRPISVIDHIAKTIESLVSYQIIDVFGRA